MKRSTILMLMLALALLMMNFAMVEPTLTERLLASIFGILIFAYAELLQINDKQTHQTVMKTGHEILAELPIEYQDLFMAEYVTSKEKLPPLKTYLNDVHPNLGWFLAGSFGWNHSIMGWKFWKNFDGNKLPPISKRRL